ncbi:MAG TPA: VWA domain-containing protein [Chitinophagales bacterium]|jgi:Ca-activated chloride channel family protein|nr:VWA domain-containing protein [Chitinophagales bacterium]HQV78306.1 VWA domain-containing protein [Chitinophagales bacterium]HQW79457.1 VWA domain-containing protein [Chitinophagales bacterium]HRB66885.1 VWA domain-containing protein [Chitinophagales bacterium]HRB93177.1 VWA domain-containing protein [Chitinophagales bacterium]
MLRFEHKEFLFLLLFIPIIIAIYFYVQYQTHQQLKKIGNVDLIKRLMPNRNEKKSWIKFILFNLILCLLILALAQPQMGTKMEKVERKGIDVMIALDVSNSMLSQDIAPSRLEKSKLLIQSLLKKLDGDRVGLVIFAGNAYLQMPLTVDYSSLMLYLKAINTQSVPTQGTVITDALEKSENAFNQTDKKHKAIIVITDGEDHEENAIDKAEELASDGTKVFTIGVGTPSGGTIPIYDQFGKIIDTKKDENGQAIITKTNANMLQALAKAGNGNYYTLDNTKQVADFLSKDISKIETKTINDKVFTDFVEQFQYFLALAFFLFLLDIFITYRKKWLDIKNEK